MYFIFLLTLPSLVHGAAENFTYQGQIVKPDGEALEGTSVAFTVEVLSLDDQCVLYREHHTLNMTGSNGIFAIEVGDGVQVGSDFADSSELSTALSNSAGTLSGLTCEGGVTSYTPDLRDRRRLRVTFDDGSGPSTLNHDHKMMSAPYAYSAQTLEGYSPQDFILVNEESPNVLSQANLETVFTNANYVELLNLLDGTSSHFVSTTPSGAFSMNSQRITDLDDPTDANDATNKNYVDTNIGGLEIDTSMASIGAAEAGEVLTWNGTQWQTQTPVEDATKLPLAGGTMSGAIVMDGNDITGVRNLGVNNNVTVTNDASIGNDLNVDMNVLVGGGIGVATGLNSDGNVSIYQQQALQLTPETSTGTNNYVGFRAPAALSATQIWTLPEEDGTSGQVMRTDGSGNLDWMNAVTEGSTVLAGDGTVTEPSLSFENDTDSGFFSPGADNIALSTGGSERARVTGTGLVGIGTASPATRLDIAGAVRIGDDVTACGAGLAGSMRYQSGNVEFCDGSSWTAFGTSSTTGTVTEVATGTGLTGGPISETGTIAIASGGVSATELASDAVTTVKILNGAVTDAKINDVDISKVTGLGSMATEDASDFLTTANNLSDVTNAGTARSNLGLGTMATEASANYLAVTNNLSDVTNAATARSNLGLGTMATEDAGLYVPSSRTITAGTGLTGGGDLSANRSINFDTTWGDGRYVNKTGDTIGGNLTVTGNVSGNRIYTNDVSGGRWCQADAGGRILCNQAAPSGGWSCVTRSGSKDFSSSVACSAGEQIVHGWCREEWAWNTGFVQWLAPTVQQPSGVVCSSTDNNFKVIPQIRCCS